MKNWFAFSIIFQNLDSQVLKSFLIEKWGLMTHTFEKYGDTGVTYVILPFVNFKFVGTWAPTAKLVGDIPDFNMFNVLNVPKMQPQHNPVEDKDLCILHGQYHGCWCPGATVMT